MNSKQPLDPGGPALHRSLRFRFRIEEGSREAFEQRAQTLIDGNNYRISDFRDYDVVSDTGGNRFLGTENRQAGRAEQRADLTVRYYHAISKLVIDSLVGPDGNGHFRMETNDDLVQNPRGSTQHHKCADGCIRLSKGQQYRLRDFPNTAA